VEEQPSKNKTNDSFKNTKIRKWNQTHAQNNKNHLLLHLR